MLSRFLNGYTNEVLVFLRINTHGENKIMKEKIDAFLYYCDHERRWTYLECFCTSTENQSAVLALLFNSCI